MLHQAARFSSIAPLIHEVAPAELLDVGSGGQGVAGWVGQDCRVTALDLEFDQAVALSGPGESADMSVVGDARALPFPDDAFDVAIALDVLEHIEPESRGRVLDELVRVTRTRVIVAGPVGRAARDADLRLAARLRARGMTPPDWLLEHERYDFPERDEILARLGSHGGVHTLGGENIQWHELLLRFEFRRPGFHLSRMAAAGIVGGLRRGPVLRAVSRIAVRLARGPKRPPDYRTIAVLDLTPAHAPVAGGVGHLRRA